MAQISISIGGSLFMVGCQDGDEAHVKSLAKELEGRYRRVSRDLAPAGEAHALFLTALYLADELNEMRKILADETGKEKLKKAENIIKERHQEKERLVQAAGFVEELADYLALHKDKVEKNI